MKNWVGGGWFWALSIVAVVGCASGPRHNESENLAAATLWQQGSAEFKALSYQTFHFAKLQLDQNLKNRKTKLPPAIVVDVDETILDNSAYQAQLIEEGKSYPYRWDEFVNRGNSPALPGAVDFMNYAASKGVKIYYITNRRENTKAATIQNLKNLGFPGVDEATVQCRTTTADKEPRRQVASQQHDIVLLLGDNLMDFDSAYNMKSVQERADLAEEQRKLFGTRYIIFANPMYGDWQGAIYNYNWALTPEQQIQTRQSHLKGF